MDVFHATRKRLLLCIKKMKFSIEDFFSEYDQINSFLRIWSHLLKKSLMENFIFCAVPITSYYFQVFWYVMKLELKLEILFDKNCWSKSY